MKLKVLAVDDETTILTLLRTALDSEGFDLRTTETVKKFRKMVLVEAFDLYLIDITLQDGNGLTLVRELRRESDAGIILLTGRTSETDHVLGLEMGADDYVTKPFRMRELAARMNAVYRRTGHPAPARSAQQPSSEAPQDTGGIARQGARQQCDFHFDGYRLRITERALWGHDNREIDLTSTEFNLLVALLTRRGQVLHRDQLMNAIKGRNWQSYDRAVDGLVSRLRRKIPRPDEGSHYIRTVHGVGYTFAA